MPIVTLTTDFGTKDYYAAALKGVLLSEQADLHIVDITHNVNNFDIVQAAFLFKNAWPAFPPGTIHLVFVNDLVHDTPSFLLFKQFDQYFICPDNGILGLIFPDAKGQIYRLPAPKEKGDSQKKLLAQAIKRILQKQALSQVGKAVKKTVQRLTFRPVITNDQIRGSIIYVDNYENAISNIEENLFNKVGKNRPFEISFKSHPPITGLSKGYSEVEVGAPLCLFNREGFLEIAINMGKAASLLGLQNEEMIQIDFNPAPANPEK